MTPEQIELLENSRLYQLGMKSEVEAIRTRFAITEKYALRVTLIVYED